MKLTEKISVVVAKGREYPLEDIGVFVVIGLGRVPVADFQLPRIGGLWRQGAPDRTLQHRVFHHPKQGAPAKIHAVALGVGLELGEDAKGLGVTLKAAIVAHQVVKGHLAAVAKRWMTNVMGQTNGLDKGLFGKKRLMLWRLAF